MNDNADRKQAARIASRDALARYVRTAEREKAPVALNFICTHNSRRSQLAQIWTTVAAAWSGNDYVRAFSGGTEVTALHPNVIRALIDLGFRVEPDEDDPAKTMVYFSDTYPPVVCWSKLYDDPANTAADFVAVMVCGHADAHCPVIPGAGRRIALRYEDPKVSDGTGKESAVYQRTAREIGAEVFSLFGD